MNTYKIYFSERVYYRTIVDAENEEEAKKIFFSGDNFGEVKVINDEFLTIDDIEKVEEK